MKKYFFLAGLPRSGNTLLSTILNQNPDLKVSSNSFLTEHIFDTYHLRLTEKYQNFPDTRSLDSLVSSCFDAYYQNWDAKYIIDRGPWGTPFNIELLEEYLKNDIKIICTARDIVEIIASFINTVPDFLREQLNIQVRQGLRFSDDYKPEVERFCDFITQPMGQLDHFLFSLGNLCKKENQKYLHLIEYKDLIKSPKRTIHKVYDFLDIPHYNHNFNDIQQFNVNGLKYNDRMVFKNNIHEVKNTIQQPNYKIKDILPQYLIDRYSKREFWRNYT